MAGERNGPPSAEALALAGEYEPLFQAEYLRIGFTPAEIDRMRSGGALTRERCERALAELRAVPTGIGAKGYYARLGLDIEALQRRIEEGMNDGS